MCHNLFEANAKGGGVGDPLMIASAAMWFNVYDLTGMPSLPRILGERAWFQFRSVPGWNALRRKLPSCMHGSGSSEPTDVVNYYYYYYHLQGSCGSEQPPNKYTA